MQTNKFIRIFAVLIFLFLPLMAQAGIFPDVSESHWAYEAVEDLAAKGIITGMPEGGKTVFNGGKPMERYQFAVALYRAMNYMEERSGGEPLILESETIEVPRKLPTLNEKDTTEDKDSAKFFKLDNSEMARLEQNLKDMNVRLDMHERDILELGKRVQHLEQNQSGPTGISGKKDATFWMAAGALLCSVAALLIAMGK